MILSSDVILIYAEAIFLIPALTFAVLALFHKRISRNGDFVAISALAICFILSSLIFTQAISSPNNILAQFSFSWLPLGAERSLTAGLLVDKLTSVMLVVVTLVSLLVHVFSTKYMAGDVRYGRYYCGLLIFTASMIGLVLADNLLFLFIFWELVGLSSYLLIGHWFEKKSASDAAIKAFITTRVGDVGMLIGLLICYVQVGSLQYSEIFAAVDAGVLAEGFRTWAGLGLFLGAMGKSAQFPFHVWLPDAMEGPTPVSALIHAATMVAAGVYLVGRMFCLFDDTTLLCIAYTGAFTLLFSASIALVQDDIKKVLAYSTISQLGYMMLGLGVGGYSSGLFHLTTHAFFKAGLFLGSGAVIYAMHHQQSLSKYGGLAKKMPKTALCYLIATLALVGFPGFSGFWSKDAILSDVLSYSLLSEGHYFLPFAGFLTVVLTAFYMFRQYFLTFTGEPRDRHAFEHAKEVPWQMLLPLVILAFLSVTAGGFGKWFPEMNPKQTTLEQLKDYSKANHSGDALIFAFSQRIAKATLQLEKPTFDNDHLEHIKHLAHKTAMWTSTLLGFFGIGLAYVMYFERKKKGVIFSPLILANRFSWLYKILLNKYYIDEVYAFLIVAPTHFKARFFSMFDRLVIDSIVNAFAFVGQVIAWIIEAIDRHILDRLIVVGTAKAAYFGGKKLALIQTGYVRQYLLLSLFGMLIVCVFSFFVL